jgi:hypothetical protein
MFGRALSILLAGYIFACPVLCRADVLCCGEDSSRVVETSCCDSCHESESPTEHESVPSEPTSPSPVECGGCICGGAVVEVSTSQHVHLDALNLIAILFADQDNSLVADIRRTTASWATIPDDGINLGRAMRCQLMSYLC